jgi:Fe-S-cluster containining protein
MSTVSDPLDVRLLNGFQYACQPGCGLCCFAQPRVEPDERAALLRIAPAVEFVAGRGTTYLRAHEGGGACNLLAELSCSAHAVRPHPCQEFPVHVHLGERLQASLVLSCPGVDLGALEEERPFHVRPAPRGFETELASVRRRIDPGTGRRQKEAERRRGRLVRALEREGRWMEEDTVRRQLHDRVPLPAPEDFPAEDPPSAEEGLERLPLYFDGRAGPVALAEGLGGWEALELRAAGGVTRHLGSVPPPASPPELDPAANGLLAGYLRYFLERDLLLAAILPRMAETEEGTVMEWAEEELRSIGAIVVSRAVVRAKLAGAVGERLTRTELAAGIRASDQDLLDVPTWGDRL